MERFDSKEILWYDTREELPKKGQIVAVKLNGNWFNQYILLDESDIVDLPPVDIKKDYSKSNYCTTKDLSNITGINGIRLNFHIFHLLFSNVKPPVYSFVVKLAKQACIITLNRSMRHSNKKLLQILAHIAPFNPWNPFKDFASLNFKQGLNHDPMGSPADRIIPFIAPLFRSEILATILSGHDAILSNTG
jgi:hypothetical protein